MCGTRASPDGGDVFKLVASAAGVGDSAHRSCGPAWCSKRELWRKKGSGVVVRERKKD
jgi:hypothetical protein